jgi:hypothetical protein
MSAGPAVPSVRPDATLWRDEVGGRFYLVPDGADPGAGPLVLRSGATRVLHADPAAVAPYEVTREAGRAFLDAKLDAFVGGTKARVESWLNRVAPLPRQGGEPGSAEGRVEDLRPASAWPEDAPSAEAPPRPEHGPGVQLLASLTGETEDRPEALLRGLGKLFESAAEAVAEARTGEEGREAALARLRALGETLRAHGISAPPAAPADAGSGTQVPD